MIEFKSCLIIQICVDDIKQTLERGKAKESWDILESALNTLPTFGSRVNSLLPLQIAR